MRFSRTLQEGQVRSLPVLPVEPNLVIYIEKICEKLHPCDSLVGPFITAHRSRRKRQSSLLMLRWWEQHPTPGAKAWPPTRVNHETTSCWLIWAIILNVSSEIMFAAVASIPGAGTAAMAANMISEDKIKIITQQLADLVRVVWQKRSEKRKKLDQILPKKPSPKDFNHNCDELKIAQVWRGSDNLIKFCWRGWKITLHCRFRGDYHLFILWDHICSPCCHSSGWNGCNGCKYDRKIKMMISQSASRFLGADGIKRIWNEKLLSCS